MRAEMTRQNRVFEPNSQEIVWQQVVILHSRLPTKARDRSKTGQVVL